MTLPPPDYSRPPANDAGGNPDDVRECLRADHDAALAALEALREESDPQHCAARLREVRTAWVVHALAEENVVYRSLEGSGAERADERFIEHELVGGLFERLANAHAGSFEWNARVNVIRELIWRHIETEYRVLFPQLTRRYDAAELAAMGERFRLVRDKLLLLERAKAA